MRILIANGDLQAEGGTETWVETMARELALEHEVTVTAARIGDFGRYLHDTSPVDVRRPDALPPGRFDVCLANHGQKTWPLVAGKATTSILTSHSTYHPNERPVPGFDHYVAVTPEIMAARLPDQVADGGAFDALIPNPIDTHRFRPDRTDRHTRIICLCKNTTGSSLVEAAADAARATYGWEFEWVRKERKVHTRMALGDIVISYGRGILEGMAAGCHVFSFDVRKDTRAPDREEAPLIPMGDGWLTQENVRESADRNFSGRASWKTWTESELADAFIGFPHTTTSGGSGGWGPAYVHNHHRVERIAREYLQLATTGRAR